MEKSIEHVHQLIAQAAESAKNNNPDTRDALHLSQAALNAANALCSLALVNAPRAKHSND